MPGRAPHQRWRLSVSRASAHGAAGPLRGPGALSGPPLGPHAAGLGCAGSPPTPAWISPPPTAVAAAASLELEFRTPHLSVGAPRAPLLSEGESSGAAAAAAVTVVVVGGGGGGGAAGAGWLGAATVESGSVSGSGSGSLPGVLLRGPGGESCRMGLRPGTARDFFPIASPSASRERRPAERGGRSARRCVINIHAPRHRLLKESAFNRWSARPRKRFGSSRLFWLLPSERKGGLYPRCWAIGCFDPSKEPGANGKGKRVRVRPIARKGLN